ncbi:hypothetical protein [Paraburkholderia sp.]|uniref:hypothetical protein n=1 Tax=Paraburkholderia sp. TaxID=1926495 RepID=UPI002F414EA4
MRRLHRKLIIRGKGLEDLGDHRRHHARITAKKVCHAFEFFASPWPRRAVCHLSRASWVTRSLRAEPRDRPNDMRYAAPSIARFNGNSSCHPSVMDPMLRDSGDLCIRWFSLRYR